MQQSQGKSLEDVLSVNHRALFITQRSEKDSNVLQGKFYIVAAHKKICVEQYNESYGKVYHELGIKDVQAFTFKKNILPPPQKSALFGSLHNIIVCYR